MYYAFIQDNLIIGIGQCPCVSEGLICLEISEEQYNLIQEKGNNYYLYEDEQLILNPNYEEEIVQKERERIGELELTATDVERAIYEAKGMDFEDLVQFVIDSEIEGFDTKRLKIELKANHFVRKHPYINMIGSLLGFTPEDMDYLFENKMLPIKVKE